LKSYYCMLNHYTQLQKGERALIQTMLEHGFKLRAITRSLNGAASTVCRELRRKVSSPCNDAVPRGYFTIAWYIAACTFSSISGTRGMRWLMNTMAIFSFGSIQ